MKKLGASILVVVSLAVVSACASTGGSTPTRPSTDSGENWARTAPTASGPKASRPGGKGYWRYPATSSTR